MTTQQTDEPVGSAGGLAPDATIHERMAMILAELPAIGKDQQNQQQNFMYRGYDDVLNALNPLLAKYGVYMMPDVVERVADQRTTSQGKAMYEINLHVRYRFYGLAGDYVEASGWGEGTDMADKATNKAMTMALKYVLFQAFAISTKEAQDADASSPEETLSRTRVVDGPPRYPVPKSWPQIEKAVRHCDNSEEAWALFEAFLRAASYHLYGETSLKKLTTEQRAVMAQKAATVAVSMHDDPDLSEQQAEFVFFTEAPMRRAWAAVLDGHLLEIPDYQPHEDADEADLDEAAAYAAAADE